MPKGIRLSDEYLDDIFQKVTSYQSEKNCSLNKALENLSKELGISSKTAYNQFYRAKGRNRVIANKKKKLAATVNVTTSTSSNSMLAEKLIYDHIKNMGFFKRLLACYLGFDKLCMRYTYKSRKN